MSRLRSLFITGSVLFLCIMITLALGALSVYFENIITANIAKGIHSDTLTIFFQTTRVLAILFLVFSIIFAFAFGFKLSASLRKEHAHTPVRPHSSKNVHVHVMNFDPYSVPTKMFDQKTNTAQPSVPTPNPGTQLENRSTSNFLCHECQKQIYNPFICKLCHNSFCGKHILNGDHICISQ